MKSIHANNMLPPKPERHRLFGSTDPIPGSKPTVKEQMTDLQNHHADYLFPIQHVGVSNVRHPIQVHSDIEPKRQTSIATMTLTTSLPQASKGINMSRLTEQLEMYRQKGLSSELADMCDFVHELAERMGQDKAEITISFPWFYERTAPVTGFAGLNHAEATIQTTYEKGQPYRTIVSLNAAVTTLCPCSKEISEYSAHNQRGRVTMTVEIDPASPPAHDWKAMLLAAAESNASSALHPVLKRPDEKRVTEQAYENPRFVEDMVRLVAADLYEMDDVLAFKVECRNEESIHLHDAYAIIDFDKRKEGAAR